MTFSFFSLLKAVVSHAASMGTNECKAGCGDEDIYFSALFTAVGEVSTPCWSRFFICLLLLFFFSFLMSLIQMRQGCDRNINGTWVYAVCGIWGERERVPE